MKLPLRLDEELSVCRGVVRPSLGPTANAGGGFICCPIPPESGDLDVGGAVGSDGVVGRDVAAPAGGDMSLGPEVCGAI